MNHLCIHSSPPPADPLPRMAVSHQPLGTKRAHSPCLSPPELLPAPFFVFHGSPTRLTRMSTPPSPLIVTGQHTSVYHRPDLVPTSSSKHSSPSPCPSGENQSGSSSPQRCRSWMNFSTASMAGPWWTNVRWVHVLMPGSPSSICKKEEGNFSKCSLFLSSPAFHLISIHMLSPRPDVPGSPTSECKNK
jgi:hypothetical protein